MALNSFWVRFIFFCGFWLVGFCDQEGFLSLSCGGTTSFLDSFNISWVSDGEYISTGNITTIDYIDGFSSSSVPVRFFPDSKGRECYRLPVKNVSSLILVRAQFAYKNYDRLGKPPAFSVSLGTAITSTVNLTTNDPWTEEFVWPVDKDILSFCLIAIPDSGYPVISSLEVRPLPQGAYQTGIGDCPYKSSLRKCYRINSGYMDGSLRYPVDLYDRIWDGDQSYTPLLVSSSFNIRRHFNFSGLPESPPVAILQTARVLARRNALTYSLSLDVLGDYYIVLYFSGVLPVSSTFDVLINGDVLQSDYTVTVSESSALYFTQNRINSLNITFKRIKFNPQVNAIEVYEIVYIPMKASSTTVSALQVIQQSTGLDLGWQDDPCSPTQWDHIGCERNLVTSLELSDISLRSISPTFGDMLDLKTLDLHNTSLAGEIQNLGSLQDLQKLNLSFNMLTSFGTDLAHLASLQVLDLQNNNLRGIVPDSLGELEDLHLLNLENNKLQGTLPQSLNKESLEVRTSGNLCLSFSTMTCNDVSSNPSMETPQVTIVPNNKRIRRKHLAIILGAVGGAVFSALFICLLAFLNIKKRRSEVKYTTRATVEMRDWNAARVFSFKEIKAATNNFKEVIGRGSFGSVYLGKLSNRKLVAVKVRFDKTQLGADSFINEVYVLSQIRHQNLVCLEGFCYESKQQIVVYEYLPCGSLADHLYGPNCQKYSLSWVRRLKIAVDAAKGLDYLHNGSQPRIIHRDVKCSNILLDKDMNAKLSDFGLSKQVTQGEATHVTTLVKGTAGYLDPEYYSTQQLTEKSDIYSFGVVLLELICGREPLSHSGTPDTFNLVLWAKPYLQAGIFEVVDESLKGTFEVESMRKAALVAARCVEREASQRPTIALLLAELKEAYSIQLSYLATCGHIH
ncbi:Pkinase domain-containing protein/Malectin_like domain-containing protein/LRR_8 domain-containing protein [Cephalotus follicularis]|uniref:non-specific serine/threonine protein kinase n=1 Tax=Cephalotus follicularis TaxID=3775 RepID=A0A1Q3BS23_CEPFO|nr:Pkinase domain-containing protein/Malectin_like domain-containing protein/LRR_8 domain-containing protein [Cephalotus follicularis]